MPTKVLVFESDPVFAGELRGELGKLGCITTVVDDGNVGLQQAASDKPNLILLAIELPRMNGFSVCNKLKKDPNLKDVSLIIMSTESSDETFEQHKKLRTRAEDYVHKPVAFGDLLQRIRALVVNESADAQSEGDTIHIDDDIEVASDFVTDDEEQAAAAAQAPSRAPGPSGRTLEAVDADVEAFAESAFGRLTGSEPPPTLIETRASPNGTPSVLPEVRPPPRKSVAPTPLRPLSIHPPGVDAVEHERVRDELGRAKERFADAERELDDARREIDKLKLEAGEAEQLSREVEELKARLAAAPKVGAVSSREFLDLRETLNKKDKEILSLKEQLSKKDKEIVESQDRALSLERGKADLDERLLALERELDEIKEKTEALAVERDLAKKASEDSKARLEKAKADGDAKDRQLSDVRAKLASARADVDQTLANERAAHARALDEVEARRRVDLEQAGRDQEAALTEAREHADRERRETLEKHTSQIQREHEGKLAALSRAHQEELDRARTAASQAARDAEAQAEERVAGARAEAEKHEQATLETLRAEHAEKVSALENERDARIAALEAKASREVSEANDRLAKLDMDLSAVRGELGSLRETKQTDDAANTAKVADLEKRLSEAEISRDELDKKLSVTSDRLAALETEAAAIRKELGDTKQKLAEESSRADKAHTKWEGDKQSLERAKDALAVALSQIEEAEGRAS
jgi:CheY-like chemotaxis protein/chromosome segregation ATPase